MKMITLWGAVKTVGFSLLFPVSVFNSCNNLTVTERHCF